MKKYIGGTASVVFPTGIVILIIQAISEYLGTHPDVPTAIITGFLTAIAAWLTKSPVTPTPPAPPAVSARR